MLILPSSIIAVKARLASLPPAAMASVRARGGDLPREAPAPAAFAGLAAEIEFRVAVGW